MCIVNHVQSPVSGRVFRDTAIKRIVNVLLHLSVMPASGVMSDTRDTERSLTDVTVCSNISLINDIYHNEYIQF